MSRKIDARVAVEGMGTTKPTEPIAPYGSMTAHETGHWHYHHGEKDWLPFPYSTDISAAWEVVEKMREMGWEIGMVSSTEDGDGDIFPDETQWMVNAHNPDRVRRCGDCGRSTDGSVYAGASTAPEAICIAALAALQTKDTNDGEG